MVKNSELRRQCNHSESADSDAITVCASETMRHHPLSERVGPAPSTVFGRTVDLSEGNAVYRTFT